MTYSSSFFLIPYSLETHERDFQFQNVRFFIEREIVPEITGHFLKQVVECVVCCLILLKINAGHPFQKFRLWLYKKSVTLYMYNSTCVKRQSQTHIVIYHKSYFGTSILLDPQGKRIPKGEKLIVGVVAFLTYVLPWNKAKFERFGESIIYGTVLILTHNYTWCNNDEQTAHMGQQPPRVL